jgi:aldose sugar dehydrogenase
MAGQTLKSLLQPIPIALLGLISSQVQAQTVADPALRIREVVAGLNQPTAMAFIGVGDILVLQKNDGKVRRVVGGVLQPSEVLDVAVDNASERGLLGIALHPGFSATPFIYLYFTESSTGDDSTGSPLANRVYRYTWNGSTLVNPILILDLPVTPGPNHNGGTMTFGPNGKLYVVIGDLNRDGKLQNFSSGPDPDDTGVIIRINDDGTVPSDNPFVALGGNMAKYYAYGVRNSFGLAFDPLTGKLWDSENGPANYDEINLVEPGFNSGWQRIIGPVGRDTQGTSDLVQFSGSHYADPKFSWFSTVGPTAIVFLNSGKLGADYANDVFVGDINNGRLYRFKPNAMRDGFDFAAPGLADLVADNNTELQEVIFGTGFGGITDLKVGPDGLLYVLSFSEGKILVVSRVQVVADFDGDIPTDSTVYGEANGNWFSDGSTSGLFSPALSFGGIGYLPVASDYDGDGKTDVAVYQQTTGNWFVMGSSAGFFTPALNFGGSGFIPVPGDYDGDGKTDVAVYQQATGNWFVVGSSAGFFTPALNFGGSGFIPVPGDYDGDGETDVAVYQQTTGNWFVAGSSAGFFTPAVNFGGSGYIPVPGDYDSDGKIDPAVYQSSTGNWFIVGSTSGFHQVLNFGGSGFMPVAGDYDGDGKTDAAVYQQSTGNWFVVGSTTGFFTPALNFGGSGFVPVLPQVTILRAMGLL